MYVQSSRPSPTFTNDNQILKYNQIGFQKGFGTSEHVFTIKTVINKYLKENKKLYICFVDFRKAYDSSSDKWTNLGQLIQSHSKKKLSVPCTLFW